MGAVSLLGSFCFFGDLPALLRGFHKESIRRKANEGKLPSPEPQEGVWIPGVMPWRRGNGGEAWEARPHLARGPKALRGVVHDPSTSRSPSAASCTPAPFPLTRAAVTCWSLWTTLPPQPLSPEPPTLLLPSRALSQTLWTVSDAAVPTTWARSWFLLR